MSLIALLANLRRRFVTGGEQPPHLVLAQAGTQVRTVIAIAIGSAGNLGPRLREDEVTVVVGRIAGIR